MATVFFFFRSPYYIRSLWCRFYLFTSCIYLWKKPSKN